MIQFSVSCLTAVRRKGKLFGVAMWERCCRAHCARALWECQPGLAETKSVFDSQWSSCSGVAARSVQFLQRRGSRAARLQLGELHHPPHNCCKSPRMGLLLLPPSAPQQYPGLVFLCWASPAPADPEVDVASNPLCPSGSGGLWVLAWCSFRVLSRSFVLDILMQNIRWFPPASPHTVLFQSIKMCWGAFNFLLGFWASLGTHSRWCLQILCCHHERDKTSSSEIKEILI